MAAVPAPAPAAETVLTPVADTFVNSGSPTARSGSSTVLRTGTSPTRRAFLRFDLRAIQAPIERVWLRVMPERSTSTGFAVHRVTSDTWSEATTSWSTAPAFSSSPVASIATLRSGVRVSVEVTSLLDADRVMSMALLTRTTTATAASTRKGKRVVTKRAKAKKRKAVTCKATKRTKRRTCTKRRAVARAAAITSSVYSREAAVANRPQLVVQTADPAPDTTAPTVGLTAPAAGSVLSGTTTVAADATDAVGVAQVEFLADGRVIGVDGVAPFTASWNTTTVADGDVTLTARALDGAGNAAVSAGRVVTVRNAVAPPPPDTTAPDTTLSGGPSGVARSGVARFSFSAGELGAVFQCSLDDAAFAPCRSAEDLHVANGRHTLRVRAVDVAGNIDPTPAQRTWWADATLQNGLFEADPRGWAMQAIPTPGWAPYQGTVQILAGGLSGNMARVTPNAGALFYSLDTSPYAIDSTVAAARYVAGGWVRSDQPGKRVCLQVRERSATAVAGTVRQCVTTTTAWQPFPQTVHTATAGGNRIEVNVYQLDDAAAGDSFELDGLTLDDGTPAGDVPATPAGDPVLLGVSDVASCWSSGDEAVSRLVDTLGGTIAMVGDTEQNKGSADEYAGCFEPSWGRHKPRTRPAVGDHEYNTAGALPYFDAFGSAAGPRGKGWYSYDLGNWHIVVLNSICEAVGGCGPGSEQYAWLEADLAANAKDCTAAYFHHPRFSAGSLHGDMTHVQPFWDVLYRYSAEFVMGGNDHTYQRFAPQTPDGTLDRTRGMRQFVVGTGGTMHYPLGDPQPNTEVQHTGTFGVLQLTLSADRYGWQFVPQAGKTFTDSGSTACSPLPAPEEPAPDTEGPEVALTAPAAGEVTGSVRLAATASDPSGVDQVEFLAGTTVVGTDSTAPYEATWDATTASGTVTLTARARDGAGNTRTSAPVSVTVGAPPPPAVNLLANGGFETSLTGWYGYRGALSRVAGGQSGTSAMRVTWNGVGTSYSVMTDPHPVGATAAGERYAATAWVRSATAGRRVCLRMREFNALKTAIASSPATCVTTTGTWQQIPATVHTALGGASMDMYAYSESPLAGDSFELDTVALTKG